MSRLTSLLRSLHSPPANHANPANQGPIQGGEVAKISSVSMISRGAYPETHFAVGRESEAVAAESQGSAPSQTVAESQNVTPSRVEPAPLNRRAIIAAREASDLARFREALMLGRLCLCGNCKRFSFDPADPRMGECARHGEAQAFVPFDCPDYLLSDEPTAPAYVAKAAT